MRRLRDQRGQSSALGAMLFFFLVIFVIFAINAGKIVTDEIHLQQTADLAAYAAAASQAETLNEIRELNYKNLRQAYELRDYLYKESMKAPGLSAFLCTGTTCGCPAMNQDAEQRIRMAKQELDKNLQEIKRKNREGVNKAENSAKETADAMWSGTRDKTKWLGKTNVVMEVEEVELSFHYGTWCRNPVTNAPEKWQTNKDHRYKVFVEKDDSTMKDTFAVVGVEDVTPDNPLAYQKMFAPTSCATGFGQGEGGRCKLGAYAAASPFYGKVGPNRDSQNDRQLYDQAEQEHMPANSNENGVQRQTEVQELMRQHGQGSDGQYSEDYKARLVGVFEGDKLESGKQWMNELKCPAPFQGAACVEQMRH